jgi:hypothetical protein
VRLPDGTLLVWGSHLEVMTPPMEEVVAVNDPRVAQANGRIYDAVLID